MESEVTDAEAVAPSLAEDQVVAQGQAPAESGGTSQAEPEGFAPFKLEDVPEEYREHVERYNKQVQGAFTRKTQDLAAEREKIKDLVELQAALESDDEDAQDAAVQRFLASHGYSLEPGEEHETEEPAGTTQEFGGAVDPTVAELQRRLDERDQREAEERESAQREAQIAAQVSAAESALKDLDTKLGYTLSDESKSLIVAQAAAMPRLEGGLPDMESAIALWEAEQARAVQAYINSKDTPPAPDLSGSSGAPQVEKPKTRADRLRLAEQVAERTYAQHA